MDVFSIAVSTPEEIPNHFGNIRQNKIWNRVNTENVGGDTKKRGIYQDSLGSKREIKVMPAKTSAGNLIYHGFESRGSNFFWRNKNT